MTRKTTILHMTCGDITISNPKGATQLVSIDATQLVTLNTIELSELITTLLQYQANTHINGAEIPF